MHQKCQIQDYQDKDRLSVCRILLLQRKLGRTKPRSCFCAITRCLFRCCIPCCGEEIISYSCRKRDQDGCCANSRFGSGIFSSRDDGTLNIFPCPTTRSRMCLRCRLWYSLLISDWDKWHHVPNFSSTGWIYLRGELLLSFMFCRRWVFHY